MVVVFARERRRARARGYGPTGDRDGSNREDERGNEGEREKREQRRRRRRDWEGTTRQPRGRALVVVANVVDAAQRDPAEELRGHTAERASARATHHTTRSNVRQSAGRRVGARDADVHEEKTTRAVRAHAGGRWAPRRRQEKRSPFFPLAPLLPHTPRTRARRATERGTSFRPTVVRDLHKVVEGEAAAAAGAASRARARGAGAAAECGGVRGRDRGSARGDAAPELAERRLGRDKGIVTVVHYHTKASSRPSTITTTRRRVCVLWCFLWACVRERVCWSDARPARALPPLFVASR